MMGSSLPPACSPRGAVAISEGSGFTKKRRKKTEAEGKTLVAWVNQHPVAGRGPRREWTAQQEGQSQRASAERGGPTAPSTRVPLSSLRTSPAPPSSPEREASHPH